MKSSLNEADILIEETAKNNKHIVMNILFALTVSISAVLFDSKSNFWAFYMGGWATASDKLFEGKMVTITFLMAWLLYGIVMGYTKKKGFMKFISLYWGIGGSICLIALIMVPIGKLAILAIPAFILILVPTYSLSFYHLPTNSHYLPAIMSITSSWSAGAIGYLFGYLLKIFWFSKLSD